MTLTTMTSDQEHIRNDNVKRFDEAATDWEEKPQRVALARKVAEAIRQAIPLSGAMQVLEYGCGTGMVSRALSQDVRKIVAVDTSPRMLEVLRRKAEEEKIGNIETLVHDLTRQPLPDKDFDLAISSMTLHHIPDIEALLHQFFAALKPGGYLAVADLVTEDGTFHDDNNGVAHFGINPETVRDILIKNGGLDIGAQEIHIIEKHSENSAMRRGYPVFLAWCRKDITHDT
ncbi:MAG: class I SAM-dependent methyltransferase [Desulfobulbaceae bacterium]|nr:class I SAM-dependent methyltransferase [Desulfobulbaceae bacterium]HIJ89965.1 class I SAM-dependent methyltransferase [Deltaproteobacteria bacterium]